MTRFTELVGCRLPIQQAGMGAVTTPELAAAVAEAGGLGMLQVAGMPLDAVTTALTALSGMTTNPFGVNFLMPFLDRDCVEAAAAQSKVVEFFYADPDALLVELAHGGGALAAWQVGSADEARAAADAGCDFVIAQGVEAGGHVRGTVGLLPLLDDVLGTVDVPIVAAGGIGGARAVAAVLAAGADGVRVGTRFLGAAEADVHPEYLERLLAARASDTVLTTAFSVMWPDAPHRVLRSALDDATACTDEIVGETAAGGVRMPIARFAVPPPTRSTTGRIGAMALYAGQSVGAVRVVQPAAEIVDELMAHAAE